MQEVFEKTTDKVETEKIKTNYAEIIIKHPLEKPYYAIVYFDLVDGEWHEGFGSYCLEYVVEWKKDCFEIVDQFAEEYGSDINVGDKKLLDSLHEKILKSNFAEEVTEAEIDALVKVKNSTKVKQESNQGWIPCSERLPDEYTEVLGYGQEGYTYIVKMYDSKIYGKVWEQWNGGEMRLSWIIAWQPLPAPYKGE